MDTEIRKQPVNYDVNSKTMLNARVHLPRNGGGLGLRPIEYETETQFFRKGYIFTCTQR